MTELVLIGDIIEKNGKTIRENNLSLNHNIPLGQVVEVEIETHSSLVVGDTGIKGMARLFVVKHDRDCDGTPLYGLSNYPITYHQNSFLSREWQLYHSVCMYFSGYSEESLKVIEGVKVEKLYDNVMNYLGLS